MSTPKIWSFDVGVRNMGFAALTVLSNGKFHLDRCETFNCCELCPGVSADVNINKLSIQQTVAIVTKAFLTEFGIRAILGSLPKPSFVLVEVQPRKSAKNVAIQSTITAMITWFLLEYYGDTNVPVEYVSPILKLKEQTKSANIQDARSSAKTRSEKKSAECKAYRENKKFSVAHCLELFRTDFDAPIDVDHLGSKFDDCADAVLQAIYYSKAHTKGPKTKKLPLRATSSAAKKTKVAGCASTSWVETDCIAIDEE